MRAVFFSEMRKWAMSRMLVIAPDAEPGGFISPTGPAGKSISGYPSLRRSAAGIILHNASAADGRGYFYARAEPIVVSPGGELQLADSMAIERWTAISAKRDTIGFLPTALPGHPCLEGLTLDRAVLPPAAVITDLRRQSCKDIAPRMLGRSAAL